MQPENYPFVSDLEAICNTDNSITRVAADSEAMLRHTFTLGEPSLQGVAIRHPAIAKFGYRRSPRVREMVTGFMVTDAIRPSAVPRPTITETCVGGITYS